jgi:hypothetical protein
MLGSLAKLLFPIPVTHILTMQSVDEMLAWFRRNLLLRIGYYFLQVNVVIAHATLLFLAGRHMAVWEPSNR